MDSDVGGWWCQRMDLVHIFCDYQITKNTHILRVYLGAESVSSYHLLEPLDLFMGSSQQISI